MSAQIFRLRPGLLKEMIEAQLEQESGAEKGVEIGPQRRPGVVREKAAEKPEAEDLSADFEMG